MSDVEPMDHSRLLQPEPFHISVLGLPARKQKLSYIKDYQYGRFFNPFVRIMFQLFVRVDQGRSTTRLMLAPVKATRSFGLIAAVVWDGLCPRHKPSFQIMGLIELYQRLDYNRLTRREGGECSSCTMSF